MLDHVVQTSAVGHVRIYQNSPAASIPTTFPSSLLPCVASSKLVGLRCKNISAPYGDVRRLRTAGGYPESVVIKTHMKYTKYPMSLAVAAISWGCAPQDWYLSVFFIGTVEAIIRVRLVERHVSQAVLLTLAMKKAHSCFIRDR